MRKLGVDAGGTEQRREYALVPTLESGPRRPVSAVIQFATIDAPAVGEEHVGPSRVSKNLAIFFGVASSGRSVSAGINRLNELDANDRRCRTVGYGVGMCGNMEGEFVGTSFRECSRLMKKRWRKT